LIPVTVIAGFLLNPNLASALEPFHYTCHKPEWVSKAESTDGIFHGDLKQKCEIHVEPSSKLQVASIHSKLRAKIEAEARIFSGPMPITLKEMPGIKWDLLHQIRDDNDTIQVREFAELSSDHSKAIRYQTHSTKIEADGMASYLKSVNFMMHIEKRQDGIFQIEFQNEVYVQRPWYALDLIFVPIAKDICHKKLKVVVDTLLNWLNV